MLRLQATHSTYDRGGGIAFHNHTLTQFDDVLVSRLGVGLYGRANDLVTYTLVVSNQAELPGYQLVITDAIPAGQAWRLYTFASDDATFTGDHACPVRSLALWHAGPERQPSDATVPFNPLSHTALTLTVVLRVADGITPTRY